MRAVLLDAPEDLIRERRRLDIDQFDEMWEGELHMSPLPAWEHQRIVKALTCFFATHWEDLGEGVCAPNVGVRPPGVPFIDVAGVKLPRSYRGPDLVFLLKGHEKRVRRGWVVGPPDALIEVRSPGDESFEKLPFYHGLGVGEVIIVHRDTKAVEIYAHGAAGYERVVPAADGSVTSRILDTIFRTEAGPRGAAPVLRLKRKRLPRLHGKA